MISFFSKYKILIAVLLLAAFFRLYGLSYLPSGLQNDEASFLLNAKAIMTTGMGEDGRIFPLFLNSFMDPKPALYSYLQIPFLIIFQDDVFAARLPGVLFGILSLILSYILIKRLTDKKIALVTLVFLAFSPWHLVLSRGTQEVIMSFFFTLSAIYFLFRYLRDKKNTLGILSLFTLSTLLAMYSYHSAKVFLPLITVSVLLIWQKPQKDYYKKSIWISLIVGISLIGTLMAGGLDRAESISLLSDQGTQLILDEQIRTATPVLPEIFIRVFHNKVINYSLLFLHEYSQYFSLDFLFFMGGEPMRYAVPFQGLFFLIELPLLLIGIYFTFVTTKDKRLPFFFLSWLLFAPLASALTLQETPSIIRTFIMVVPLTYFIAIGAITVWDAKSPLLRYPLRMGLVISLVFSFLYFLNFYAVHQPLYRPWHRQYAEQTLVQQFTIHPPKEKRVIISGAGDIYVYFALADLLPISDLQNSNKARRSDIFTTGKYTFMRNGCYLEPLKNTLFVVKKSCEIKPGFSQVGSASYKDGTVEYLVLDYTGQ